MCRYSGHEQAAGVDSASDFSIVICGTDWAEIGRRRRRRIDPQTQTITSGIELEWKPASCPQLVSMWQAISKYLLVLDFWNRLSAQIGKQTGKFMDAYAQFGEQNLSQTVWNYFDHFGVFIRSKMPKKESKYGSIYAHLRRVTRI